MRTRIPPLLPTYFLLVLVVVFAVGSLWVGLDRLDAIEELADSRAKSAATVQDLQALQALTSDIVFSAQAFARTDDSANLDLFERARRSVPGQLTSLRDRMRDTPSKLALLEQLVPLIGQTIAIAEGIVDRARAAPDEAKPSDAAPYRDALDGIRSIIAKLEAREQDELATDGRALRAAITTARILHYALAALIVLLAALLFMAVRRLSAFIPPAPRADAAGEVDLTGEGSRDASSARIGTLLRESLVRARIAAAATPADDEPAGHRIRASIEAIERAPLAVDPESAERGASNVIARLAVLARTYSPPDGLRVVPTLDQSVGVHADDKTFVIDRVAAWALEVIATRKRNGEVALAFASNGENASLRVLALLDHPDLPLRLTPHEREEAEFLRRAAAAAGGQLAVSQGPTGFAVVLTLPLDA